MDRPAPIFFEGFIPSDADVRFHELHLGYDRPPDPHEESPFINYADEDDEDFTVAWQHRGSKNRC